MGNSSTVCRYFDLCVLFQSAVAVHFTVLKWLCHGFCQSFIVVFCGSERGALISSYSKLKTTPFIYFSYIAFQITNVSFLYLETWTQKASVFVTS